MMNPAGLKNTLIANNTAHSGPDIYGQFVSEDHNLVKDTSGADFEGMTEHNIYGQDPNLAALTDNGGDAQTHALQTPSPAIDAIPLGANSCSVSAHDQRSAQRANGSGAGGLACDIGAYEYEGETFDRDVTGPGFYRLHKTLVEITVPGALSNLKTTHIVGNHPNRTGVADGYGVGWGEYWNFAPSGDGFTANLTLPTLFTPDAGTQICRYRNAEQTWDCAVDGFSESDKTATRAGITSFSDWAAGKFDPNAVAFRDFRAEAELDINNAAYRAVLVGVLALALAGWWACRRVWHARR